MTQEHVLFATVAFCIMIGVHRLISEWYRKHKLARKPVIKTYSCPHQEVVEFSGGYRESARQVKKCSYKIKICAEMSPKAGTWSAFCPVHGVKLKT